MRYLYAFCLGLLLAHTARGQAAADSLALAADSTELPVAVDTRWVRSETDSAGICTEILHWSGVGGLVRAYYPTGQLKEYIPYSDLLAGRVHGVATSWYESGQLRASQTLIQGQRDSLLLLYYENGQLKRRTRYVAGVEQVGVCFDSDGRPVPYFPYEQPPLYPGGQLQIIKEISQCLRQWQPAGNLMLNQAQIHLRFQVAADGHVENPEVTITNETFALVLAHSSSKQSLQATLSQGLAPLISRVQRGLTNLAKPFYPGKRDGDIVSWQYSMTVPFTYGGGRF
jgi:protein TonB